MPLWRQTCVLSVKKTTRIPISYAENVKTRKRKKQMDRQQFLNGSMPAFMREAHALITLQYAYDEDARDEETKDREMHEFMDSMTDPHGVMMYLASYTAEDFTKEEWQQRLLEVEEVFRGSVA